MLSFCCILLLLLNAINFGKVIGASISLDTILHTLDRRTSHAARIPRGSRPTSGVS